MRKLFVFLLFVFIAVPAVASKSEKRDNPFFGNYKNQLGLYIGHSVGPGPILRVLPNQNWQSEPFEQIAFQYSQPFEFFRLPARQNVHATLFWRHGDVDVRTLPAAGLSWDVALLQLCGFYFGAGLGGFIKPDYARDRQDSLFMFGSKLFFGYRISQRWSAEIYTHHFDNGGLTSINGGYNFVGGAVLVNF
ncbi:MAG: acyloxyacyl hydrolase [Alphaproteobacteria bacterium]|nr:acyloxyacyl hydrolase [Alphaproteobacteria bacterium]